MHEYHKAKKSKPQFQELLKNFEFKTDEGKDTIINKSKLNKEFQNVSRVCMRKYYLLDGSTKDADSVSPSCVKNFDKLLQDKRKIHEGI